MRRVVKCLFQYLADDALFILRVLNCVVVIRFWKAVTKCPDCVSATARDESELAFGVARYSKYWSSCSTSKPKSGSVLL